MNSATAWYRQTDKWRRPQLVAKAGTKWHVIDEARSNGRFVNALCEQGIGSLREPRDLALIEVPTVVRPGTVLPTPGRGATCANCYRKLVKALGS